MNLGTVAKACTLAISISVMGCVGGLARANAGETLLAQADQGDFLLEYQEPENSDHQAVYEALVESSFYDEVMTQLNDELTLPQDIRVVFTDCGEENAFYTSEDATISMCYELIAKYAETFYDEEQSDYTQEVINAAYFTFFHELGHALVDQFGLPIVGREEDAVDSFATVLLLWQGEETAAIAGIDQFNLDAEEEADLEELAYWDEHSLNGQRFYNVACLVYGSDPAGYEDWVSADFLPESRAERCEGEYAQAEASWSALLSPYLKSSGVSLR
ncbi:MAG TPA: DUF4344 domain-containing metallopeptidase [Leptolyngbyaceae cyanobacterium]